MLSTRQKLLVLRTKLTEVESSYNYYRARADAYKPQGSNYTLEQLAEKCEQEVKRLIDEIFELEILVGEE